MSTQVVPSSPEQARELLLNSFFNARIELTDWRSFLDHPERLDPDAYIQELQSYEPVPPYSPNRHRIFVLQNLLRLGLRHREGLPLEGPHTCSECGTHLWDPTHCLCLYCAEMNERLPYCGSRGSCEYLKPIYDIRTESWGLLYYSSMSGDEPVMFFVASGFATVSEAFTALLPFGECVEHLRLTDQSGRWFSMKTPDVVDPLEIVGRSLPLSPDGWRKYLREALNEVLDRATPNFYWEVRKALDALRSQMKD